MDKMKIIKNLWPLSDRKRRIYFFLGIISGLSGFASKVWYRPMINNSGFNDFGISGSAPSFFATFGACFLGLSFFPKHSAQVIFGITLGQILYEIEQIWTSRTFDIGDIVAIILASFLCLYVHKKFERAYPV
jgi:hypothetical protein